MTFLYFHSKESDEYNPTHMQTHTPICILCRKMILQPSYHFGGGRNNFSRFVVGTNLFLARFKEALWYGRSAAGKPRIGRCRAAIWPFSFWPFFCWKIRCLSSESMYEILKRKNDPKDSTAPPHLPRLVPSLKLCANFLTLFWCEKYQRHISFELIHVSFGLQQATAIEMWVDRTSSTTVSCFFEMETTERAFLSNHSEPWFGGQIIPH